MAKQSFVTGQVLTAAQMTSLQQTAMLGGAASAKTASYTLVAADAGTAISMSNASATTITVNTALFAAGDTVQITNLGVGVCTITAGTATVNTSASLALAQYESGTLDFTSTSAAIFIKGAAGAAASGGMTLLSTTSLTGSSVTLSSIDQTYVSLVIYMSGVNISTNANFSCNINATSQTIGQGGTENTTTYVSTGSTAISLRGEQDEMKSGNTDSVFFLQFDNYASTTFNKTFCLRSRFLHPAGTVRVLNGGGSILLPTTAISSLQFFLSAGTFSAGSILLYGVK